MRQNYSLQSIKITSDEERDDYIKEGVGCTWQKICFWMQVNGHGRKKLFTDALPQEEWEEIFAQSRVVHYFQSSRKYGSTKILRPANYGRAAPSLLYVGMDRCPLSYWSARPF